MFVWMRCEIECLRKRTKTVNATIIQCPLCNRSHWFACVSESTLSDIKHKVCFCHVYSAGQQKQNWCEWRNVSMLIQEVPGVNYSLQSRVQDQGIKRTYCFPNTSDYERVLMRKCTYSLCTYSAIRDDMWWLWPKRNLLHWSGYK